MNPGRLNQRGQGIVEFAVIFPVFAILLFAVIDGGLVMGRYNGVNHAASIGARFGAVQPADNPATAAVAVVDKVKQTAPGKASDYANSCDFSANDAAICVQWLVGPNGEAAGDIGSSIRVAVKYHYSGLTPLVKGFGGWDITACITERQEQVVTIAPGDPTYTSSAQDCGDAGQPTATSTPVSTNTPVPTPSRTPTHPQQTATARAGRTATAEANRTATSVARTATAEGCEEHCH